MCDRKSDRKQKAESSLRCLNLESQMLRDMKGVEVEARCSVNESPMLQETSHNP